ncbi:MAG: peptidylprolyl isomerase, partial [Rhodospirillaceae bacterium]
IAVEQDEILSGIEQWEQRIGLPPGQLTALSQQIGIDKSTIVEQVETSVTWNKLLREKFLPTITYEEREIDDILAEELSRRGQPEFRVLEIYLPYSRDRSRTDVQTQAERLVAEIRQGAPFDAVARNFSQSPTAGVGGDLGWLRLGHLPTELENVIKTMAPDTVSAPIATFDGVYLLQLVEKRAIEPLAERSGEPATVTVHQIHFELPPNPSDADRAAARQRAQEISAQARNCTDMDTLGQKYGTSLSGSPGKLLVDQLSALVRDAIVGLPVHQTSRPIDIEGGLIVVMVCDRLEPKTKAISQEDLRRQIVNRLINERVNLAARQFLRSLRQAAIIDIRI